MVDESRKPEDDDAKRPEPPAPWERQPVEPPGDELRHTLAGGDQVEYTADESQQASYLADDRQSLQSRIGGGGLDQDKESEGEVTRLCLGCGKVTTFVQGQCSSCGYKMSGAGGTAPPEMIAPGFSASGGAGTVARNVVITVVVLALVVVAGYLLLKAGANRGGGTKHQAATATTEARSGAAPKETGPLNAVTINTAFHGRLTTVLEEGNQAWADAGIHAYVYRYGVFDDVVPGRSQVIRVSGYVGGDDADTASVAPQEEVFRDAVASFFDDLNKRNGVDSSIFLMNTGGDEAPAASDVYIRYGYYYGKEHWNEIGKIVDQLEGIRDSEGQYPLSIQQDIVHPRIRTYGGMRFIADGFGYIPIFKADSNGKVIMGTGKGLASYMPEECTGYYLLYYTDSANTGLDLYGPEGLNYYHDKISPFPYQPKHDITNVPLEPDGKPDGIAAVVKNGELMKL